MPAFDHIAIIFNPQSTGDAPANARGLAKELATALPNIPCELLPTERPGHAEGLAYTFASEHPNALIVSASGDGGYNEVINGALRAGAEGAKPICAVLPSGNANDHAHSLQGRPLSKLIRAGSVTEIDVLQVRIHDPDKPAERYAHSYVGLGLTPKVAVELNKHKLNRLVEAWIVFWELLRFRPVAIEIGDRKVALDSLVCGNVPQMAKILSLSGDADPRDGRFELTVIEHRHKFSLFSQLLKGVFNEIGAVKQLETYVFGVVETTLLQCDGELMEAAAGSTVEVAICPRLLRTIAEPPTN
jgi:diacylglycerol kinase family enzyme